MYVPSFEVIFLIATGLIRHTVINHMPKRKIDRQEIAFWVYLALLVIMAVYGLWNSAAAEPLIRALRDAFSLIIQ